MTTIKTIRRVVFGPTQDEDIDAMMAENVAKIEAMRVASRPAPVPATKQLRTNLERVTLVYNDRERVLVAEIAEREAELADVRRARDATTTALMELDVDLPELDVDAAQVAAMSDGPPWMAQMADPPHRDIHERVNTAQVALEEAARHGQ